MLELYIVPLKTNFGNRDELPLEEALDWFMRLQSAPDDAALRAASEEWVSQCDEHREAYRRVERTWALSGDLPPLPSGNAERAARFGSTGNSYGASARAGIAVLGALAASFLLLFSSDIYTLVRADYRTGTAEIREVILADGSKAYLDADTAIMERYEPSRREIVLLSGQAFFEVAEAPDRPFVVTSKKVETTAIGTAFAVGLSSDTVSVSLASGKVGVSLGGQQTARLVPGGRLVAKEPFDRFETTKVDRDTIGAWREGRLIVDGAPLAEVVEALDRHYRGIVVLRGDRLATRRVTGVFDLARPLVALEAIARSQHGSLTEITPFLAVVSGP